MGAPGSGAPGGEGTRQASAMGGGVWVGAVPASLAVFTPCSWGGSHLPEPSGDPCGSQGLRAESGTQIHGVQLLLLAGLWSWAALASWCFCLAI